uniref:Kazal-like domain-containing protein n=1 Tax=Periophthalmus magnuspinnatus TaxID=409849 RepID=A0A3B3ZPM7_9GOBI
MSKARAVLMSEEELEALVNTGEDTDDEKVHGNLFYVVCVADPCDTFRCKRGKTCKLDDGNKPSCVCQVPSECPPSLNELDHVCGTDNKTYDTSCELFATKCNLEGTKKGHRLHLDYTGSCKLIPPCLDPELIQFPLRMRDWLKNVLLQLYEHDTTSPGFLTPKQRLRVKKIFESERRLHAGDHSVELLERDFEKNYHMYIYPVHWQFAQLDQHPSDRYLSHSELAPLRVPLVPMEHCTSLFFQECDSDKDKQVSFKEWTSCFGIKEGTVIF